jgi:N-methylhydantoinase A/oxoprolinase/acetone carboxylase beta subunit
MGSVWTHEARVTDPVLVPGSAHAGKGSDVRRRVALLVPVLAVVVVPGCGVGDDRAAARETTERFYAAIRADEGQAACAELSEDTVKQLESQSGQSCADVVTRLSYEGGGIERVQVYATNAKVDLTSGESAFLSPDQGEWKLSAIGCRPEEGKPRDRPLDCEAEA